MACFCEPGDRAGRCRYSSIVHSKVWRELSSADLVKVKNWTDPQEKIKTKTTKDYVSRPIIPFLEHERSSTSWTENLFLAQRPYQTLEVQERQKEKSELDQISGENIPSPLAEGLYSGSW